MIIGRQREENAILDREEITLKCLLWELREASITKVEQEGEQHEMNSLKRWRPNHAGPYGLFWTHLDFIPRATTHKRLKDFKWVRQSDLH